MYLISIKISAQFQLFHSAISNLVSQELHFFGSTNRTMIGVLIKCHAFH